MHDKEDDKDTQPDEKLIQNNVKKQKTPLSQRIKLPKLPPFDQIRKLLKPPVALLIGLIMCLSDRCREAIGQGALLTTIVLVFYFPSRTFGKPFIEYSVRLEYLSHFLQTYRYCTRGKLMSPTVHISMFP